MLNKLGYETKYSCQGHSNLEYSEPHKDNPKEVHVKFLYSQPYIAIDGNKELTDTLTKIFKSCMFSENFLGNTEDYPDGTRDFAFYLNRNYIDELLDIRMKKSDGRQATDEELEKDNKYLDNLFKKHCKKLAKVLQIYYNENKGE